MSRAALQFRFQGLAQRQLFVGITVGVARGLAVVAAATALLVVFDGLAETPAEARFFALLSAVALGFAVTAGTILRAAFRTGMKHLAERVDSAGETGGQVRTGVDLLLDRPQGSELTTGLAVLAIRRASVLATRISPPKAIPFRGVVRPLLVVGGLGFAAAGVATVWGDVFETQWLRLTDPFGDHPPWSRTRFTVEPGDVRVVYGTGLEIQAAAQGQPVDRAILVLRTSVGETAVPMFPDTAGVWRATLDRVTESGVYFVRARTGRSHRHRMDVSTVPVIERVDVRIRPPEYTGLPEIETTAAQGNVRALGGSRVLLTASSNRPLSSGLLSIPGESQESTNRMHRDPTAANAVKGSFEVSDSGTVRVTVTDVAGQSPAEPYLIPLTAVRDEPPTVRIAAPPAVSLATPTAVVPVDVRAEDDYGLVRMQLRLVVKEMSGRTQPVRIREVEIPPPFRREIATTIQIRLADLLVRPGDEVSILSRVWDSFPDLIDAPNADPADVLQFGRRAESNRVVLKIVSQLEFERLVRSERGLELLRSKYRQARDRLDRLRDDADRLRKKPKEKAGAPKEPWAELDRLAKTMREETEGLRELSRQKLGLDLDQELNRRLEALTRRMENLTRDTEALARERTMSPEQLAKALDELYEQLDRERSEMEKEANDPVERLAETMPLLEDARKVGELTRRQRALADRLRPTGGEKPPRPKTAEVDPATRRDLGTRRDQQQRLHDELEDLVDAIEEHAARLPDGKRADELRETAAKFAEAVRASQAGEAQQKAAEHLNRADRKAGHAEAERAAAALEKLCDECQGSGGIGGKGRASLRFSPGLGDRLGRTVEQLLRRSANRNQPGGPSDGQGTGNGTGESASPSEKDDLGLYGKLPGLGDPPRSGESSNNHRDRGQAASPGSNPDDRTAGKKSPTAPPPGAATAGDATVPAAYRRRVADYFQRIADESGR